MTLWLSLKDLEQTLSASTEDGFNFAYQVNSAAREVHEDVWEERPEREFVQDEVLPLMKNACRLIKEVYLPDKKGIFDIMDRRVNNLQRYVEGKRSDFCREIVVQDVKISG